MRFIQMYSPNGLQLLYYIANYIYTTFACFIGFTDIIGWSFLKKDMPKNDRGAIHGYNYCR